MVWKGCGLDPPNTPEGAAGVLMVKVAGVTVIWLVAFARKVRTLLPAFVLETVNVSVRRPTPRSPVGWNQTFKVQVAAGASATPQAVATTPVGHVVTHVPWAWVPGGVRLNSLPDGMVKVTGEVPRPPELPTVTVTGVLMAVIAVPPNSAPRVAVSAGPVANVPDRVAVSLSVAPATVALAVTVAASALAVSEAGMSRMRLISLQRPAGIVAAVTWSLVTTKSAAFAPVMLNCAPVAAVAAALHTDSVICVVPAVPTATAEKVRADGTI